MDELDLIKKYLRPLSAPEAFSLSDDTAIIKPRKGKEIIITTDSISSGVHFFGDETGDLIASRLIRTAISDLASSAAEVAYCLINAHLPSDINENFIRDFCLELRLLQEEFKFKLLGGDTVRQQSGISYSATFIGFADKKINIRRSNAQFGDDIYISGYLGEAAAGLTILKNHREENPKEKSIKEQGLKERGLKERGLKEKSLKEENPKEKKIHKMSDKIGKANDDLFGHLFNRYYRPMPRLTLGIKLGNLINSCADISDGLIVDLQNICDASDKSAHINISDLPYSNSLRQFIDADYRNQSDYCYDDYIDYILYGGDDYELVFTASPEKSERIAEISSEENIKLTKIGSINKKLTIKDEVVLLRYVDSKNGKTIIKKPIDKFYRHF